MIGYKSILDINKGRISQPNFTIKRQIGFGSNKISVFETARPSAKPREYDNKYKYESNLIFVACRKCQIFKRDIYRFHLKMWICLQESSKFFIIF